MSLDDFSTACLARQVEPVALAIRKRGRDCIVAKLTGFSDGKLILAITVKNQVGTSEMLSLPVVVIDYAERHGARWLYWRRDRYPMEMRRVELGTLRQKGYLKRDGEIYFPIAAMEVVPWREWRYAKPVVKLEASVHTRAEQVSGQLRLPLGG